MISDLREGQPFPQQFILSRRLVAGDDSSAADVWLATNEVTGDRVVVRILPAGMSDAAWQSINDQVSALRGLVHESISVANRTGEQDGARFLIEPFIAGAHPLEPDDDRIWQQLTQTIDALDYAHKLDIPHGNLHPGNILVDSGGAVHLTGFGIPGTTSNTRSSNTQFQSPQVKSGNTPSIDDDTFSLGCLVFRIVTGNDWHPGALLDAPMGESLEALLRRMTSEQPFARDVSLADLKSTLRAHFEGSDNTIESISFSRRDTKAPDTDARVGSTQPVRQTMSVSLRGVIIGAVALLLLAALLFGLLPTGTSDTNNQQATPVASEETPTVAEKAPPPPATTPLETARLELMQQQGEELAREILREQLSLEDIGVMLWARDEYEQIAADLNSADSVYRSHDYVRAMELYDNVMSRLLDISRQANEVLARHIEIGDRALAEGDADTALTAFTITVAIDNESEDLAQKLYRAENLEEVLDLVREGEVFERNGDLGQAEITFASAVEIDGAWGPARKGLNRVREQLTLRRFQSAMSDGFSAIDARDYKTARAAFQRARKIVPGSSEPDDGLAQIEQAEKNDIIQAHRRRADKHLAAEEWQAAIDEYKSVLDIADSLEFARTGVEYAETRLALQQRIQKFLQDPTLLQSDEGLREASTTLKDATRQPDVSREMLRHIDILARLISTARVEIPVTIRSDGKTDVTVRRHVALGRITSHVVHLIPGRYTIVGERPGYRDVREDVIILAGETVPEVVVASTEKVRR